MRYIGLPDSAGVDICQGDILSAGKLLYICEYIPKSAGFLLKDVYSLPEKYYMGIAGINTVITIVGNICQNPELLPSGRF